MKLFIEGQEVDLFGNEDIVLTRSVNDLLDLNSRQGDYSNTFNLPKTNKNKAIFGNTNSINSTSNVPYKVLPAKIETGGVTFEGNAILKSVSEDFEVLFTAGNADFFKSIEGKTLKDIDFSDYNHKWDLPNIAFRRLNDKGLTYPVADYQADTPNERLNNTDKKVDVKTLAPNIYLSSIVNRIAANAGFRLEGNVLGSTDYQSELLPCLNWFEKNPPIFKEQRELKVRCDVSFFESDRTYRKIPFSFEDYDPLNLFLNGTNTFNFSHLPGWGVDFVDMAFAPFGFSFKGTAKASFNVVKQGNFTAKIMLWSDAGLSATSNPVLIETKEIPSNNPTLVEFSYDFDHNEYGAAFRLFFTVDYTGNTATNKIKITGSFDIVNVPLEFRYGHGLNVNNIIPAIPQSEVIKYLLNKYCLLPITRNKTVELVYFSDVIKDRSEDWTKYLDRSEQPVIRFAENYAKNNLLNYKKDKDTEGFGDSSFIINNETLTDQKEAVTLPFAYSNEVFRMGGIRLANVPIIVSGNLSEKVEQRILKANRFQVGKIIFSDLETEIKNFGLLKYTMGTGSEQLVSGYITATPPDHFKDLKAKYYPELIQMLQNYKEVEILMRLPHGLVSTWEFKKAVFINDSEIGGYYYPAEIMQHKLSSNESCYVRLIKIN
jgi:hypothetical protein